MKGKIKIKTGDDFLSSGQKDKKGKSSNEKTERNEIIKEFNRRQDKINFLLKKGKITEGEVADIKRKIEFLNSSFNNYDEDEFFSFYEKIDELIKEEGGSGDIENSAEAALKETGEDIKNEIEKGDEQKERIEISAGLIEDGEGEQFKKEGGVIIKETKVELKKVGEEEEKKIEAIISASKEPNLKNRRIFKKEEEEEKKKMIIKNGENEEMLYALMVERIIKNLAEQKEEAIKKISDEDEVEFENIRIKIDFNSENFKWLNEKGLKEKKEKIIGAIALFNEEIKNILDKEDKKRKGKKIDKKIDNFYSLSESLKIKKDEQIKKIKKLPVKIISEEETKKYKITLNQEDENFINEPGNEVIKNKIIEEIEKLNNEISIIIAEKNAEAIKKEDIKTAGRKIISDRENTPEKIGYEKRGEIEYGNKGEGKKQIGWEKLEEIKKEEEEEKKEEEIKNKEKNEIIKIIGEAGEKWLEEINKEGANIKNLVAQEIKIGEFAKEKYEWLKNNKEIIELINKINSEIKNKIKEKKEELEEKEKTNLKEEAAEILAEIKEKKESLKDKNRYKDILISGLKELLEKFQKGEEVSAEKEWQEKIRNLNKKLNEYQELSELAIKIEKDVSDYKNLKIERLECEIEKKTEEEEKKKQKNELISELEKEKEKKIKEINKKGANIKNLAAQEIKIEKFAKEKYEWLKDDKEIIELINTINSEIKNRENLKNYIKKLKKDKLDEIEKVTDMQDPNLNYENSEISIDKIKEGGSFSWLTGENPSGQFYYQIIELIEKENEEIKEKIEKKVREIQRKEKKSLIALIEEKMEKGEKINLKAIIKEEHRWWLENEPDILNLVNVFNKKLGEKEKLAAKAEEEAKTKETAGAVAATDIGQPETQVINKGEDYEDYRDSNYDVQEPTMDPQETEEVINTDQQIKAEGDPEETERTMDKEIAIRMEKAEKSKNWRKKIIIGKQVIKTLGRTVASIAGIQSIVDVPAWLYERTKVRGKFLGIKVNKGLAGSVDDLLIKSFKMKKERSPNQNPGKKYEGEGEKEEVMKAIEDLNKRLKLTREGSQKGSKERKMMADLLLKHRKEYKEKQQFNKEETKKEMSRIIDNYITTKTTGMQAARETLNSFFTASGSYALRGASYGIMDALERNLKLRKELKQEETTENNNPENKGLKEKIKKEWKLIKNTFWGEVKETYKEATFQDLNDKKRSKLSKSLNTIRAWGKITRYLGIGIMAGYHPETAGDAIDKVIDALEGKVKLSDVENNFIGNIEKLGKFYSRPIKWAENKFLGEDSPPPSSEPKLQQETSAPSIEQKNNIPLSEEKRAVSDATTKLSGGAENQLNNPETPKTINQNIIELGIVHKNKGIEHALIKQLEADPEKFGFDPKGKITKTDWINGEAHRLAIKSGYIKFETGGKQPTIPEQIRIGRADSVSYILGKNEEGKTVITEYFKDDQGGWQKGEDHIAADDFKSAKFEGKDKEAYEYIENRAEEKPKSPEIPPEEKTEISSAKNYDPFTTNKEEDIYESAEGGKWTKINFENKYALRMVAIDKDGNNTTDIIRILNEDNEIIRDYEINSENGEKTDNFINRADEIGKDLIKQTEKNYAKIENNSIEIEMAQKSEIKIFDKEGISEDDAKKLQFWSKHDDILPPNDPKIAKNFFQLSREAGIKYDNQKFIETFRNMPPNLKNQQQIGYTKIFAQPFNAASLREPLKELLGEDVIDTTNLITKKGDNLVIHDAYGHKGFDIIINKNKTGIDGPLFYNKWLQSGKPTKNLSFESIKTLKELIKDLKGKAEEALENSEKPNY
jgi:hypothetical protein